MNTRVSLVLISLWVLIRWIPEVLIPGILYTWCCCCQICMEKCVKIKCIGNVTERGNSSSSVTGQKHQFWYQFCFRHETFSTNFFKSALLGWKAGFQPYFAHGFWGDLPATQPRFEHSQAVWPGVQVKEWLWIWILAGFLKVCMWDLDSHPSLN